MFVVRPFVDSTALSQFSERLSGKDLEGLTIVPVKNLILREADDDWSSWLSEESRDRAKELEYV